MNFQNGFDKKKLPSLFRISLLLSNFEYMQWTKNSKKYLKSPTQIDTRKINLYIIIRL